MSPTLAFLDDLLGWAEEEAKNPTRGRVLSKKNTCASLRLAAPDETQSCETEAEQAKRGGFGRIAGCWRRASNARSVDTECQCCTGLFKIGIKQFERIAPRIENAGGAGAWRVAVYTSEIANI